MIISLIILSAILTVAVAYLLYTVREMNKMLFLIDKEQHVQNTDIIKIWKHLATHQKFQLDQFKFNDEVAKGFEAMADRDLVRQIQNLDPHKIGKA